MMYVKQKIALHIVPDAGVTRHSARPDQTPADLFRDIGGLYVNNYFKPLSVDGLVKSPISPPLAGGDYGEGDVTG